MTLADFATFSTAVSGVAVTASLIYLALQTHQNAKHTKALIQQGRAARITEFYSAFSDTDRVAAVLAASGQPAAPEDIKHLQYRMIVQAGIVGVSEAFQQHQAGLLSNDELADLKAAVLVLVSPQAQMFWEQWKAARPQSHVQFKAWVDSVVGPAISAV